MKTPAKDKTLDEYLTETGQGVRQFAEKAGLSISYVYELVWRKKTPSLKVARMIEAETGGAVKATSLIADAAE